ncbi:MAG: flagellar protein FlaG [Nitrospiraceae bacterium]|nr:flagellar protein FlaG [Nitrospiraceae bacterium]
MDIKLSNQAAVNTAFQLKPAPGQTQSGAQGNKAAGAKKAAEETPAKKAVQQAGQQAHDKAIFAVDGNNKVVIQVLDANGKVLQQLPPEEFGPVAKELKALMKNLFSREA